MEAAPPSPMLIAWILQAFSQGRFWLTMGAVGAHFGALAALYTLGFVNVGMEVLVKGDGAYPASVLTAVGNAATASVTDIVAGHGALVAGNVDHFDDIGLFLSPPMASLMRSSTMARSL